MRKYEYSISCACLCIVRLIIIVLCILGVYLVILLLLLLFKTLSLSDAWMHVGKQTRSFQACIPRTRLSAPIVPTHVYTNRAVVGGSWDPCIPKQVSLATTDGLSRMTFWTRKLEICLSHSFHLFFRIPNVYAVFEAFPFHSVFQMDRRVAKSVTLSTSRNVATTFAMNKVVNA